MQTAKRPTTPFGEPASAGGPPSRSHRHRGLGLIELLMALAITAGLLTAVAVAVDASFRSYQVNQEQALLTDRARLTLYRMLTTVRTTKLHQPYTAAQITNFSKGQTITDIGFSMYDDTNTQTTYLYDAASQELRLTRGGVTHVLLAGVKAFQVKMEPMKSAESVKTGSQTYDLLMRATVLITLATNDKTSESSETTGTQTATISSSVMPRRNVW